jgi:hypothetical protein
MYHFQSQSLSFFLCCAPVQNTAGSRFHRIYDYAFLREQFLVRPVEPFPGGLGSLFHSGFFVVALLANRFNSFFLFNKCSGGRNLRI